MADFPVNFAHPVRRIATLRRFTEPSGYTDPATIPEKRKGYIDPQEVITIHV
jgi:hypothetical protein